MTTNNVKDGHRVLRDLGFTDLEARIYAYLLGHEPATAYRIAHAIGKPAANTYQAVASLAARGAVQVDEGESRLVRSVPAEELLARLERGFRERRERAAGALAELERPDADDRVYALRTPEQVLERARAMLARAEVIAVLDVFPGVFALLRDDLAAAAGRGVRAAAKVYAPAEAKGVDLVREPDPERARSRWPGQQLSLVVDAREHLLALFDRELAGVHQALWSQSTFLSCLQHNHVAMEIAFTRRAGAGGDFQADPVLLLNADPPGLADLRRRLGEADPGARAGAGPAAKRKTRTGTGGKAGSKARPRTPSRTRNPRGGSR